VLDALADKKITNIAAGSNFCYAHDQISNEVYSWGMGYNYVLGTRDEETEHVPVKVHTKMFHDLPVKVIGPGS
jgi:alpha-tubulin suppressor-like RCC1 family protein